MLTEEHFDELLTLGYTVVEHVMTSQECDETIGHYNDWIAQFDEGLWPYSEKSVINKFNTGNMHPTWYVRLKTKGVFAQIWKTDKLLTSVDGIAIGRPPEEGEEEFHRSGNLSLRIDQSALKRGLHAYQGAVYLEHADEDDWTFAVMEGSHMFVDHFYKENKRAESLSVLNNYYGLRNNDVNYFDQIGCPIKRVAVPKGGMILLDSRLVYANANPIKRRKNPGRWRYCVFVSMTPAIWASRGDMETKREAYKDVAMTTHWSSQGVQLTKAYVSSYASFIDYPTELPAVARSRNAKLLSGAIAYDFNDGVSNGDGYFPKWQSDDYVPMIHEVRTGKWSKTIITVGVLGVVAVGVSVTVARYMIP